VARAARLLRPPREGRFSAERLRRRPIIQTHRSFTQSSQVTRRRLAITSVPKQASEMPARETVPCSGKRSA
jgi:hypothetical protein